METDSEDILLSIASRVPFSRLLEASPLKLGLALPENR
jgi:hypothetical protein